MYPLKSWRLGGPTQYEAQHLEGLLQKSHAISHLAGPPQVTQKAVRATATITKLRDPESRDSSIFEHLLMRPNLEQRDQPILPIKG